VCAEVGVGLFADDGDIVLPMVRYSHARALRRSRSRLVVSGPAEIALGRSTIPKCDPNVGAVPTTSVIHTDFGHPAQGQTLVLDPLVFLGRKLPALDAAIVDFVVFAIADCAFG
jgi:hypothetical protein